MTTMNMEAQQLFDRYLQTVRWSVRGVADADEIENDVRAHVSSALEGAGEDPVTSQTLRDVLARLGDPWQWIPPEELPLWRRITMRFSLGPEDWRLAYTCFAMTVFGFLLLPVGVGFFILLCAFFLARATHELASDRDGSLGPRRWLVYPPLVFFSGIMIVTMLIGPPAPIVGWGIGEHGFERALFELGIRPTQRYDREIIAGSFAAMTLGAWWILGSLIGMIAIRPLRWLLVPFANSLRRVHLLWLTALGAAAAGAGAAVFYMR